MVAHFAGKISFVGVRAVGEGWGRGASTGTRDGESRDSRARALGFGRARDGTDGLQTAQKRATWDKKV